MSVLVEAVIAALTADPDLMTVLTGGVWGRPIARESGLIPDPVTGLMFSARSTPEAFDPDPPYTIRPCVYVKPLNETRYPGGPDRSYAEYVQIWCYASQPDADAGRLDDARRLIRAALDRRTAPTLNGAGVLEMAFDATGPMAAPEFPEAVVAVETFRAAGVRYPEGVHV